jgi:2-C-methyl-D-erythritol 4-phosphate cytidylyltransferase
VAVGDLSALLPLPIAVADNKAAAFAPVAGQAPLVRVVRAMLGAAAEPTSVIVATADALVDDVRETLAAHHLSVGVAVATGSATRAQCLLAGLEYLEREQFSLHHVLIHDIRRPLASTSLRDRVIAELRKGSTVVMPALPLTDSVKTVDAQGSVTRTLDRSTLQAVQYPRGLAADQLARLLTGRVSEQFDELEEAMRAGVPITVVDGDPDAFLVDLPTDTAFVDAVIACRRGDS